MGQPPCAPDPSGRCGLRRSLDSGDMGHRGREHQYHGQAGLDESIIQGGRPDHRCRTSIKGWLQGCIDVLRHPAGRQTPVPGHSPAQIRPAVGRGKTCAHETSSSALLPALLPSWLPHRIRKYRPARLEAVVLSHIRRDLSAIRLRFPEEKFCSTSTAAFAMGRTPGVGTTGPTCFGRSWFWKIKKVNGSAPSCRTAVTGVCRNLHSTLIRYRTLPRTSTASLSAAARVRRISTSWWAMRSQGKNSSRRNVRPVIPLREI